MNEPLENEHPERIAASECFFCGDETDHPQICDCGETICPDCIDEHIKESHDA